MASDRFETPQLVEFSHSRWYTIITIVDKFGVKQQFKASADSHDTDSSGLYFAPVNTLGEEIDGL